MAKITQIKDAAELLATTGLSLSRYLKGLGIEIKKMVGQKTTPARAARLKRYEAALAAASKKTSGKAKPKTGAKGEQQKAPASESPSKARAEAKRKAAERDPSRTPAEQREYRRLVAGQKTAAKEDQGIIRTVLKDTTRVLTKEGQALYDKADKPSLRRLRNDLAKGDSSRFSYPGGRGTLKAKTGGPDTKAGERRYSERMAEEIDARLQGEVPYTSRQAAEKMGLSGKGKAPTEEALKARGGFEIKTEGYKKGGLKKYQSRVKYGGKEYAYMGGGMVGDIPHFKPKKKSRKK
jgi:hypothetical protein